MQPRDNLSLLQTNTYTYTYTYWVLYTYTYEVLYTHTHTHTHIHIGCLTTQEFLCWINATSFQIGNFGKWEFWGTLESSYCPLAQPFAARRRRRHVGCCSVMLLLKVMLGTQQQQQQQSPYKQIICYKTCLSVTYSDEEEDIWFQKILLLSSSGDQQIIVACWLLGAKRVCPDLLWHDSITTTTTTPMIFWSMCNNFWRSFGQIEEPPPTSCTMQDEWFCENRITIRLGWMWFW